MNSKTRHWTFIVYPDHIIPNWIDFLIETGLPFSISPLHDHDINPDGTIKKFHYHVIVCFDGPTTYKNVKENICDSIGATIPKRVLSLRGIYRYLTHEDNPEKYHYDRNQIAEYNNFKLDLTDTEINMIKIKIIDTINDMKIDSYSSLINYYINSGEYDQFNVVSNHVYFFSKYIDSNNKTNYN